MGEEEEVEEEDTRNDAWTWETMDEDPKGKNEGGRRHHPPPVVQGHVPRANTIERTTRA